MDARAGMVELIPQSPDTVVRAIGWRRPEAIAYSFFGGTMLDRGGLVVQMAKVIAGERVLDPAEPGEDARRRADEALARVEIFLGVDVDEARDIVTRVLHDVS